VWVDSQFAALPRRQRTAAGLTQEELSTAARVSVHGAGALRDLLSSA
jgi:hypothetical protein